MTLDFLHKWQYNTLTVDSDYIYLVYIFHNVDRRCDALDTLEPKASAKWHIIYWYACNVVLCILHIWRGGQASCRVESCLFVCMNLKHVVLWVEVEKPSSTAILRYALSSMIIRDGILSRKWRTVKVRCTRRKRKCLWNSLLFTLLFRGVMLWTLFMTCFNAACQHHNSYFQPLQSNNGYLCLKDPLEELCCPADLKAINVLTLYSWVRW